MKIVNNIPKNKTLLNENIIYDKKYFDELYIKYCKKSFVDSDPVNFIYKCNEGLNSKELTAFIVSLLCFGKRENIIKSLDRLLSFLGKNIYKTIYDFNFKDINFLKSFVYRFINGMDLFVIFYKLHMILKSYRFLRNYFYFAYKNTNNIYNFLNFISKGFDEIKIPTSIIKKNKLRSRYQKFLIPSPINGSACKRMNLFLKWMVRKDDIDLGLWKNIPKSNLIIPLDIHVAKMSKLTNLTLLKTPNWNMAIDITNKLKSFDFEDPIKYDISLFGLGIELKKSKII